MSNGHYRTIHLNNVDIELFLMFQKKEQANLHCACDYRNAVYGNAVCFCGRGASYGNHRDVLSHLAMYHTEQIRIREIRFSH